jgi:hypothetical protein
LARIIQFGMKLFACQAVVILVFSHYSPPAWS